MTLKEIIDALEKADGPDREIDAQIWLATTDGATRQTHHIESATGQWAPYDIDETRDVTGRLITVPAYTASVDAAIALCERILPGCKWEITTTGFKPGCTIVSSGRMIAGSYSVTPALALCTATLRAKLRENTND